MAARRSLGWRSVSAIPGMAAWASMHWMKPTAARRLWLAMDQAGTHNTADAGLERLSAPSYQVFPDLRQISFQSTLCETGPPCPCPEW